MANFLAILPNKKADLFPVCLKIYLFIMVLITPLSFPRPIGKSKISKNKIFVNPNILQIPLLTPHILCAINYITAMRQAAPVVMPQRYPGYLPGLFLFILFSLFPFLFRSFLQFFRRKQKRRFITHVFIKRPERRPPLDVC